MTDTPVKRPSHSILQFLPGLIVSLLALAAILYFIDWREVFQVLKTVNLLPLILVLPVYLVSYLCRARAWQLLLNKEVPLKRTFYVMNVGYLLNNTLPFRLGEVGRVFILGKELRYLRMLSSLIMERAFDLILAASLLIGTLPFVLDTGDVNLGLVGGLILGISLVGFLVLYLLSANLELVKTWLHRLFRKRPRVDQWLKGRVDSFFSGLSVFQNAKTFFGVFTWMLLSWMLSVVVQFGFIKTVIPQATLLWAGFVQTVMALGVALPSSPAYVGVYEGAVIAGLAVFNVEPANALAYALISHVMSILVTGIFGTIGLVREGTNIGAVYRSLRSNFSTKTINEERSSVE